MIASNNLEKSTFNPASIAATITIYGNVLSYPPLGGISHHRITLEMALLNQLPPLVKLEGKRILGSININSV